MRTRRGGTPARAGSSFVSDDGALINAIDEALAAQPGELAPMREGKVHAGAAMKAMGGCACAERVRQIVLERAEA